jgi:hypothetical protein
MNITQKAGLGLLLVSLGAPSAFAALTSDAGSDAAGIELSSENTSAQRRIDLMLDVKVLDETALQRQAKSAVRAPAPMGGHYDREGADAPQLYGQQDFTRYASYHATPEGAGDSAGLAQATAVHMVGSGDVAGTAPVISSGAGAATQTYVAASPPGPVVPLPPSFLLLASGLFGLSGIRLRIKQAF